MAFCVGAGGLRPGHGCFTGAWTAPWPGDNRLDPVGNGWQPAGRRAAVRLQACCLARAQLAAQAARPNGRRQAKRVFDGREYLLAAGCDLSFRRCAPGLVPAAGGCCGGGGGRRGQRWGGNPQGAGAVLRPVPQQAGSSRWRSASGFGSGRPVGGRAQLMAAGLRCPTGAGRACYNPDCSPASAISARSSRTGTPRLEPPYSGRMAVLTATTLPSVSSTGPPLPPWVVSAS